jgi:hypothetical protein
MRTPVQIIGRRCTLPRILLPPVCIMILSACASHPAQIDAPDGPILASAPTQAAIDPARLMISGQSDARFAAPDRTTTRTIRVQFESIPPDSADWRTARRSEFRADTPSAPETLAQVDSLTRADDGSIAMPLQTNMVESVEVNFDPPLIVLPAGLQSREPFVQSTTMTVHPLGQPTKVRAKGTVKQTITLEGRDRVRTPAGEFDAFKVLSSFEADLGPTAVNNRTEQWLADGAGLIAERRSERTTLLGLRIRANDEFWLLDRRP